jgi:hypothetical protein
LTYNHFTYYSKLTLKKDETEKLSPIPVVLPTPGSNFFAQRPPGFALTGYAWRSQRMAVQGEACPAKL